MPQLQSASGTDPGDGRHHHGNINFGLVAADASAAGDRRGTGGSLEVSVDIFNSAGNFHVRVYRRVGNTQRRRVVTGTHTRDVQLVQIESDAASRA